MFNVIDERGERRSSCEERRLELPSLREEMEDGQICEERGENMLKVIDELAETVRFCEI